MAEKNENIKRLKDKGNEKQEKTICRCKDNLYKEKKRNDIFAAKKHYVGIERSIYKTFFAK